MQDAFAAVLIAIVLVLALRGLKGLLDTQRRARAVMQNYQHGTNVERAAIEREAEAKRELHERMRTSSGSRTLILVLLLALAALFFLRQ